MQVVADEWGAYNGTHSDLDLDGNGTGIKRI